MIFMCACRLCPKFEEYSQEFQMSDTMKEHFNTTTKPLLDKISAAVNFTVGKRREHHWNHCQTAFLMNHCCIHTYPSHSIGVWKCSTCMCLSSSFHLQISRVWITSVTVWGLTSAMGCSGPRAWQRICMNSRGWSLPGSFTTHSSIPPYKKMHKWALGFFWMTYGR